MATMKEHMKGLAEAMLGHHVEATRAHSQACDDNLSTSGFEFHKSMIASHTAMADKCRALRDECEKTDDASDLAKITSEERAVLSRLLKTVVPDHVRAVGTENPNRLIARQGDPQPETSDAEIPAEFVEVFQT